jgi:hypothetical protein
MHTGKLCYSKLNYRVTNTPAKPNMHARLKTVQRKTNTNYLANFREEARQQEKFSKT